MSPNLTTPPQQLSPAQARAALQKALPDLSTRTSEWLPLQQAQGRLLAQDLLAKVDHPSLTESALDGIACFCNEKSNTLQVVGESRAGAPFVGQLQNGQCIRIYTGAALPSQAGLGICPVEELDFSGEQGQQVTLRRPALAKDVRHKGEDFAVGQVVLSAGQQLSFAQLALAAAAGHAQVPVYRPWRVGLLSTGDEVVRVGQPLAAGQVYDSNHAGLTALLAANHCQIIDLGQAPDQPQQLAKQLSDLEPLDLILSSGGVSMGRYDFLRDLLFEHPQGQVLFWKITMRPGGPAILGRWNGTPIFGLPGNPVSSLVVFKVIVEPVLQGKTAPCSPSSLRLRSSQDLRALPKKTAFWRGYISGDSAQLTNLQGNGQGSGQLSALATANALLVVKASQPITAGEMVEVIPL